MHWWGPSPVWPSPDQLGHGSVLQSAQHWRISRQGPWRDETFFSLIYWMCSEPWNRRMKNSSINRRTPDTSKVPLIGYLTADTNRWGIVGKLTHQRWWHPTVSHAAVAWYRRPLKPTCALADTQTLQPAHTQFHFSCKEQLDITQLNCSLHGNQSKINK